MATGPDDVRFRGKTGSSRSTTKMTRLTQSSHQPNLLRVSAKARGVAPVGFLKDLAAKLQISTKTLNRWNEQYHYPLYERVEDVLGGGDAKDA